MRGDELIGLVAVTLLFGGGTLFLLAISPVGKAIAARILGKRSLGPDDDEVRQSLEAMRSEVDELRHLRQDVTELAERVDFTERLLAKQGEQERRFPGASRGD